MPPRVLALLAMAGCASGYVTPGGPAPPARLKEADPAVRDA